MLSHRCEAYIHIFIIRLLRSISQDITSNVCITECSSIVTDPTTPLATSNLIGHYFTIKDYIPRTPAGPACHELVLFLAVSISPIWLLVKLEYM